MNTPEFFTAKCADGVCRQIPVEPNNQLGADISASVGKGGHNKFADVRTVQDVLNQVPARNGGPETELKVDAIVGTKTLSAIRKFQKEECGFRWPDERVDPKKRTHRELARFYLEPNPYYIGLMYAALPNAVRWMRAAQHAIKSAELALSGGFTANDRGLRLLNKYFHIDQLNSHQQPSEILRINSLYLTAISCIGHKSPMSKMGMGYFQQDLRCNLAHAYTSAGGYHLRGGSTFYKPGSFRKFPNSRADAIYVCPRSPHFKKLNIEFYTMLVIHELAHFCGPLRGHEYAIVDHSYRRKGQSFFKLSAYKAIRTADCYAQFASEAALGKEIIT